jgi:protein gp37
MRLEVVFRRIRRNIQEKINTRIMSRKLVIGDVSIVRIDNEIRYNIPEGMTGKKLEELKEKYSSSINEFLKTSKS